MKENADGRSCPASRPLSCKVGVVKLVGGFEVLQVQKEVMGQGRSPNGLSDVTLGCGELELDIGLSMDSRD